jgi:hypothetical protein
LNLIRHVSDVDHPGQNGNHSVNRLNVNDSQWFNPAWLRCSTFTPR